MQSSNYVKKSLAEELQCFAKTFNFPNPNISFLNAGNFYLYAFIP